MQDDRNKVSDSYGQPVETPAPNSKGLGGGVFDEDGRALLASAEFEGPAA